MTSPERILVTAALPYANGPAHLGHFAGCYLPADIYCRYQRLMGRDVAFICGSDEHGAAIMIRARKDGVTPQEIVDRYDGMIRDAFVAAGMSFDYYGRTSSERHRETSQAFFQKLAEDGRFDLKTESQLYDPEADIFLADRFVKGTCPVCKHDEAYGDQCEKCGSSISPSELINPRSTLSDATPIKRETTHWYLDLSESQAWLDEWIGSKTNWKTNVLGQVKSWLNGGLGPRAMTRDLAWGVPVPPEVAKAAGVDASGKVLYVWFDAPIGYISATREWAEGKGDPDGWEPYWKGKDTKLVHFLGKDNIVFHCIIFPAMLRLHGDYVLPDNVPANEFLNLKGAKFSTSRGVAVWLHEFLETFPADYLRYSVARVLPETKDADFGWEDFQAHINNELADTFGNFVNRAAAFASKYFDGILPPLDGPNDADKAMLAAMEGFPASVGALIEEYRFRDAIQEAMNLARAGNKYFNDAEPWATRKTDMRACGNTIHVSLQVAAGLSVLFEPFLPTSCAKIRATLGIQGLRKSGPPDGPFADAARAAVKDSAAKEAAAETVGWKDAGRPLLTGGQCLGTPEILFHKVDDDAIRIQIEKLIPKAPAQEGPPYVEAKPMIEFDDFAKVDLRVGHVLEAVKVEKSKKLLQCQVDLGSEVRQILAGVAEHLAPEDLVGKKVVVVANLAPRKMMGLESQGMLLMAEDREGKLTPVSGDSEPGSTVK